MIFISPLLYQFFEIMISLEKPAPCSDAGFSIVKTLILLRFKLGNLAEREGFEPSRGFIPWHVSSVLVSATHPPLRVIALYVMKRIYSNVSDYDY